MFTNVAAILVGLGLFLSGLKMVSVSMKQIASRQLRLLFARWSRIAGVGFLGGLLSGAIFQSGSNAAFIMSSFVSGGFIDIKTALPIIAAANIGTAVLVFLVAGDSKLVVIYLLATTSILYGFNRSEKRQKLCTSLLGISLLLYGFQTLQSGVKPFAEFKEFQTIFYDETYYYLLPFVIGVVLRLLTLSSSAVTVIVVTIASLQILAIGQLMAIIYGGSVGAALVTFLFSSNFRGIARQISIFQIMFELSGAMVLGSMLIIENYTYWPLVERWVMSISTNLSNQVAYIYLLTRVVPTILTFLLLDYYVAFLQFISPPTIEEDIAKPQYIFEQALEEPETAMDLLEREQLRILRCMIGYFEQPLLVDTGCSIKNSRSALQVLDNEMKYFIAALFSLELSPDTSKRLVNIQNRQSIINSWVDGLFQLANIMETSSQLSANFTALLASIKEGLLTIIVTAVEGAEIKDKEELTIVLHITEDRGGYLEELRHKYLFGEKEIPQDERVKLVEATDQYKHVVWLIRKWTELLLESKN